MKPYYADELVCLYLGDCRDVLPLLDRVSVVITDPVWPNAVMSLAGSSDPYGLFSEVAALVPRVSDRLVVQLGFDSDPRFLLGVPRSLPYLRTCWLRYACPSYKGRLLHTGDVAYAFGTAPSHRAGRVVIPGEATSTQSDWKLPHANPNKEKGGRENGALPHPAPRRLQHVQWLVKWFEDGSVLDPFAGIGTTLLAAKHVGVTAIGIEIDERFCDVAARRLESVAPRLNMAAETAGSAILGWGRGEQSEPL